VPGPKIVVAISSNPEASQFCYLAVQVVRWTLVQQAA
jgi:hypothetical protein